MTMPTGDAQTSPPTHDGSTPPLPRAAADTAAEAKLTALDVRAMDRYAESCQPHDVRALAADWLALAAERDAALTGLDWSNAERDRLLAENAALQGVVRDERAGGESWMARAEAAEAERDRLSAELAAAKDAKDRFDAARNAALDRAERAEAEVAALRGAMPDAALLDYAAGQLSVASRNVHIASSTADQYRATEESLSRAAAAIRAALATATPTPTPPAAEAGTGWDTRRLAWLASELAMDWEIGGVDVAGFAYDRAENSGREAGASDLLYALRFAIDTAVALDTPQEADHA